MPFAHLGSRAADAQVDHVLVNRDLTLGLA
jgi:hypothetical protein